MAVIHDETRAADLFEQLHRQNAQQQDAIRRVSAGLERTQHRAELTQRAEPIEQFIMSAEELEERDHQRWLESEDSVLRIVGRELLRADARAVWRHLFYQVKGDREFEPAGELTFLLEGR